MTNKLTATLQKILYNDKVMVIDRLLINAVYEQFYKKEFEKPLTDGVTGSSLRMCFFNKFFRG